MRALDLAPERLLVVTAHPDDAEFFAGGFLARCIARGTEVHLLLLTDGQGGSMDPSTTRAEIAVMRRREQEDAARVMGIASVRFLGEEDGALFDSWALRVAVARRIREVRPQALLTTDPQNVYGERINHPDHRIAGEIALAAIMPVAAVRQAGEELAGLEPHTVSHVLLAAPAAPNVVVALEERDFTQKIAALRAHSSQMTSWDVEGFMRTRAESAARAAGLEATLAEPFVHVLVHG